MSFRPSQKVIYTAPGTYNWVCPPDVNFIDLVMIGAGGGGGGGGAGGVGGTGIIFGTYGGGGGGASGGAGTSGQYSFMRSLAVTPGATYMITVGAFGTGGAGAASATASGVQGQAGGDTTFTFPNSLVLKASGGLPGYPGSGGGNGSFSTNGGGAPAVSSSIKYYGWDGSAAGDAGGTASHNSAFATGNSSLQIYQIFTDIGGSPADFFEPDLTPSNANYGFSGVYGPFGEQPAGTATGNTAIDVDNAGSHTLDGNTFYDVAAYSLGGSLFDFFSTGYAGGGAGGVLSLINLIPIYYVGVDLTSITLPIVLPYFYSYAGSGLGNGGELIGIGSEQYGAQPNVGSTYVTIVSNGQVLPQSTINVGSTSGFIQPSGTFILTNGSGPQTITYTGVTSTTFTGCTGGVGAMATNNPVVQSNNKSIAYWADGTAPQIGFGAGGLGGPGGGGAFGSDNVNFGRGYHGDQGLSGMVMISWS